jgi:predicted metalloprotease with PDZ domain
MVYAPIQGSDWLRQINQNFETIETAQLIELASEAETITGTDATKGVTPAGLQAKVASATAKGIVELATDAEAIAGTDADRSVTPATLAAVTTKLDIISFSGIANAGACTLTGVKVGDLVLSVTGVAAADVGDQATKFEAAITVNDQIQQTSATDLSTKVFMALILRKS